MIDVYLYATDNQRLPTKGDTYLVRRRDDVPGRSATVKVARLKYAGNWDPEPGGWRRLANDAAQRPRGSTLDVRTGRPGEGSSCRHDYALADLTGTATFTLTAGRACRSWPAYVAGGGTLLVDAAGGKASRSPCRGPGGGAGQDVPHGPELAIAAAAGRTAAVYAAGGPLGEVGLPAVRPGGSWASWTPSAAPRVAHRGRPHGRAVLSNEDVAAGLVGQQVDGIVGYAPATATSLAEHVVRYAIDPR